MSAGSSTPKSRVDFAVVIPYKKYPPNPPSFSKPQRLSSTPKSAFDKMRTVSSRTARKPRPSPVGPPRKKAPRQSITSTPLDSSQQEPSKLTEGVRSETPSIRRANSDTSVFLTLPHKGFHTTKKCNSPLKLSFVPHDATRAAFDSESGLITPQDLSAADSDTTAVSDYFGQKGFWSPRTEIATRTRKLRYDPVWSGNTRLEKTLEEGNKIEPKRTRRRKVLGSDSVERGRVAVAKVEEIGPVNLEVIIYNDPSLFLRVIYQTPDSSPTCVRPFSVTHISSRSHSSTSSYLFKVPPSQHSVDVKLNSAQDDYEQVSTAYLAKECVMKVSVRGGRIGFALRCEE